MKITIESIPHLMQRYNTVGDWAFEADGTLVINVSEMPDQRSMIGVAIHELAEAILCKYAGITAEQVDEWDMNFKGEGEPGNDPACPYLIPHIMAQAIEARFTEMLGLKWTEYDKNVEKISATWRDHDDDSLRLG